MGCQKALLLKHMCQRSAICCTYHIRPGPYIIDFMPTFCNPGEIWGAIIVADVSMMFQNIYNSLQRPQLPKAQVVVLKCQEPVGEQLITQ
jgi:hypothetical protein